MHYTPYQKFINFLENHNIYDKQTLNYIRQNSTLFDYNNEEYRSYISTVPVVGKDGRLKAIKSIVPHINDDMTILINIHEYIRAIVYYQKIGKRFKEEESIRTLQLFYERLFILENPTEELMKYKEQLEDIIIEENRKEYVVALNSQKELQKYYETESKDIENLKNKSKTLTKKYINQYSFSNRKKP